MKFIEAEEALLLFKEGKVRGVYWCGDNVNLDACLRQVKVAGLQASDFAFVQGPHPLSGIIPVNSTSPQ